MAAAPPFAPEFADRLRRECRMNRKQAAQLAALAHGKLDRAEAALKKIVRRWSALPAVNPRTGRPRVPLGGYCFKALRDELTRPLLF